MKPPFAYFGGKTKLGERIAAALPAHRHYVEPFAGSLAVLLAKAPSVMETVNDLDHAIINFWRVLRDRPAELERGCALTPHSRVEFEDSKDMNSWRCQSGYSSRSYTGTGQSPDGSGWSNRTEVLWSNRAPAHDLFGAAS